MVQQELIPQTPTLLDAVLIEINTVLANELSWLNNLYGRAEKIRKKREGSQIESSVISFPAVYTGKKGTGYFNLLPDKENENYSFFIIQQPETIVNHRPNSASQKFKTSYSLVVWYKISESIMPANEHRNQELIKKYVANAIAKASGPTLTKISIESFDLDPERIFREYTFNEIPQQYLMHPYGAIRINGQLNYEGSCSF